MESAHLIRGAAARLLSWWILLYLIGVRIPRAVGRRCRLWKILRYSKMALANLMRFGSVVDRAA